MKQLKTPDKFHALGLMSGSSLDGVDLAYCTFKKDTTDWHYSIVITETIAYQQQWIDTLRAAPGLPGHALLKTHIEYGRHLGRIAREFLTRHQLAPHLVASHGHTIFHEPTAGFTFQFGDGQAMASATGHMVVCDFRAKDISLGGQGAPLVPVGDELLFGDYAFCLNIGGIANVSYQDNDKRIAFDICPANQMINHIANQLGKPYDDEGRIARSGKINQALLNKLNTDDFYSLKPPKSLSNQYVQQNFIHIIDQFNITAEDKLRTVTEHIAVQLTDVLHMRQSGKILISGGGAHNTFLMDILRKALSNRIILPDKVIIDYKEAMIFAFLGVLRSVNEINCLSSVTGASGDCSGGVIYHP